MSFTSYPEREIRLVAPFPPGHVSDLHLRVLAPHVAEALQQPVTVENWSGESGTAALERLKQSPPDGYTLMMHGYGGLALAPHLLEVGYQPAEDFTAIVKLVTAPLVLVANASLPVDGLDGLMAFVRQEPGRVQGLSFGHGSNSRLALALFTSATGLDIPHTAYPGGFDTIAELLANDSAVMFEFPPAVMPHIAAGRLKALAVTTKGRSGALPDVPTLEEEGVEGVEMTGWQGIIGPLGIPPDVVDKLNATFKQVHDVDDVRHSMEADGYQLEVGTPEDFAAFIRYEYERWGNIIKEAGLRPG